MSITSLAFFVFIAALIGIYYICPGKLRWGVLLVGSLYFYLSCSSYSRLAITLVPLTVTYLGAMVIAKLPSADRWRIGIVVLVILVDVGFLCICKEQRFFVDNGNILWHVLGQSGNIPLWEIVAPLGISYYTLNLISYLLDVYWEITAPQKNYLKFMLYGIYFPIMVSGPFVRYQQMERNLYCEDATLSYEQFCMGLQRILWGLFKKLVIADRLGIWVASIWNGEYYGSYIFLGVLGYAIQVYMDFSGCMDIVIGVSSLLGITLPENFRTPLYAVSLSEYWRRWHITLGVWAKDYIMYPILKSDRIQKLAKRMKKKFGKKRGKQIPTWIGLLAVWIAVGFWHGGAWTFIFGSGLFFFLMIVGGQILEPAGMKLIELLHINTGSIAWKMFQRIRTFVLFSASISFSWSTSMEAGFAMWKRGLTVFNPEILIDGSLFKLGLNGWNILVLVIGLAVVFIVSYLQQSQNVLEEIATLKLPIRWSIYIGLLFAVLIFGMYGPGFDASSFIYGQF